MLNEIHDLNKLEKWYNNKFLPEDVISDMRKYWESKKADSIIKVLGKSYQEEISHKILELLDRKQL